MRFPNIESLGLPPSPPAPKYHPVGRDAASDLSREVKALSVCPGHIDKRRNGYVNAYEVVCDDNSTRFDLSVGRYEEYSICCPFLRLFVDRYTAGSKKIEIAQNVMRITRKRDLQPCSLNRVCPETTEGFFSASTARTGPTFEQLFSPWNYYFMN